MDTKISTKRGFLGFSVVLVTLALLDILTTQYSLSLGAVELNPLLRNASFDTMVTVKLISSALIIGLCVHFKTLVGLALAIGINIGFIWLNIRTILLLN